MIDITLPVHSSMLVWPGDPAVSVTRTGMLERGDVVNVSQIVLGSHTGTHVDPPFHFIDGAATVDELPLDALVGEAFVADARGLAGALGAAALDGLGIPAGEERVLLRTDNSDLWSQPSPSFPDDYVSIAPDGAEWLVERGVRLAGIDFLSIEAKDSPGHPTHMTLLRAGVVIVEGLDLRSVSHGMYRLAVLPLRVADGDGAPARAVLW